MERLNKLKKFKEIKVSWCRKSLVGDEYPFNVVFDLEENEIIKDIPIFEVNERDYKEITESLNDFKEDYPQYFVIKSNGRFLAIDTEGFKYPRYKSPVCYQNEILPF